MSNPCDQIFRPVKPTTPLRKEGFAEHYRKAFSTLGRVGFGWAKGCKKGANFTLDEVFFFFVWMLHGSTKVLVRAVALLSATIGEIEKQRLDLFFGFDPLSQKN